LESIFAKAATTYGISENLLKAVAKAESDFDTNAVSSAGAQGIMQLMPATAKALGVTNAFDPEQNIMGGAKYLSQMLERYDGDTTLALAAYNAGPGNVKKYGGVPPFKSTQNYIKKVLSYAGEI
jgi:soluble lytic murein transglycosylase-like protein